MEEFKGISPLSDYIRTLKIEPKYTIEKIELLKSIGPYFPEEYIPMINRSILFTERILKVNELAKFMSYNEYQYIKEPIPVENNRERISKVVNIVQKEASKIENNNLGLVIDLIVNMDKYKNMFSMLNSIMSNQEGLNDPAQLFKTLGPLLGVDGNKDKEKLKDINRMMEIIRVLNSPKKEIPKDIKEVSDNKKIHLEDK